MRNDRRVFLAGWLAVAGTSLSLRGQQQGQYPNSQSRQPVSPPGSTPAPGQPGGTFPEDVPITDSESSPSATPNPRAVLQQDRKDLQHDAATLLQMSQELKKQLDALDTTEVLSLDLVHKAEAIEKLAHQMKELLQER
jgi:hypothetical protein